MNLRSSLIERAVRQCANLEAKRNVRNAYKQLHFMEDILQLHRTSLSLQSRAEIVRASADDLPGRIQSEGLILEGLLNHHRAWLHEEVTLAMECSDKKLGYSAVALIEKESHSISEAQRAIIKQARKEAESEASKKDKPSFTAPRGSNRSRGRGRGSYSYNNFGGNSNSSNYSNNNNNSNYNNYKPMRCVLCNKTGHLANHCRQPHAKPEAARGQASSDGTGR